MRRCDDPGRPPSARRRDRGGPGRTGLVLFALALAAGAAGGDERPRIGLALSGGGAKGAAHVGVLQVLEELRVPVDAIAGTSMGAVVGGLYASGVPAADLERLLLETAWSELLREQPVRRFLAFRRKQDDRRYLIDLEVGIRPDGLQFPSALRSGRKLSTALRRLTLPVTGVRDFDRLPIPFRAVATDAASGEMVVLGEGDLARAIRASMSLPGTFAATELDDRLLLDGGIVNNLPVDVVRAMGADVVIAVDIGARLEPREELGSALAILNQTLSMTIRRNTEPRLADADLVIAPELAGFGLLQFGAAEQIVEQGRTAARAEAAELSRHALPAPRYRSWREARRPPADPPIEIEALHLEGAERVDERRIRPLIEHPVPSRLDLDLLVRDLERIYGLGEFRSVSFSLGPAGEGSAGEEATVHLEEKSWGPNYLHMGIFWGSDLEGDSEGAVLLNLVASGLERRGTEWRTDLALGSEPRVGSELFRPFGPASHWFAATRFDYRLERPGVFARGRELARLEERWAGVTVDLGVHPSRFAELRLGLQGWDQRVRIDSGSVADDDRFEDDGSGGGLRLAAAFDSLDDPAFPSRGSLARLELLHALDALGDDEFTRFEADVDHWFPAGRTTLLAGGRAVWSAADDLPPWAEPTLGGIGSLSGFTSDELRGQAVAVLRLGARRPLGSRFEVGAWVEAGNAWQAAGDASLDDLETAVTGFVSLHSPLGPISLALGQAEGGRRKAYLVIGRPLR